MIKLFDIEDGVVKPTPHCKMIKWLAVIQEKFPEDALQIYAYIFYMSHEGNENPYFNLNPDDREEKVLDDLDARFSTEEDEIIEALAKAKELYTTPTMQAYNSLRVMLNNIGEYMETAKVTAGRDGNLPSLIRLAKEFDSIRQSFKGVAKNLVEEQKSTARGGQDLAYDEEGE